MWLELNGGLESDKRVYAEMQAVVAPVYKAMDEQRGIGARLAQVEEGSREAQALAARYEQLEKQIAAADGYNAEVRIRTVLGGMGFADRLEQRICTMSGGEKTRLKLCRLLPEQPEILFLYGPTNHLDVSTLYWPAE